jgi:hypothetical protein
MTKKRPISLAVHYRKNRNPMYSNEWCRFENAERIRLASMLVKREDLAKVRTERRREEENQRQAHLIRFLYAVGGAELFGLYRKSQVIGLCKELGITQHPDYDKRFGVDRGEEE